MPNYYITLNKDGKNPNRSHENIRWSFPMENGTPGSWMPRPKIRHTEGGYHLIHEGYLHQNLIPNTILFLAEGEGEPQSAGRMVVFQRARLVKQIGVMTVDSILEWMITCIERFAVDFISNSDDFITILRSSIEADRSDELGRMREKLRDQSTNNISPKAAKLLIAAADAVEAKFWEHVQDPEQTCFYLASIVAEDCRGLARDGESERIWQNQKLVEIIQKNERQWQTQKILEIVTNNIANEQTSE